MFAPRRSRTPSASSAASRRSPPPSVLTLALGIGANTALFAVVEAVLLRPLPYADAERLVLVKHRDVATGLTKHDIAIGDFSTWPARQQSFERSPATTASSRRSSATASRGCVEGVAVTPEAFAVLGLQPAMGRRFDAADGRRGAPPVVIVSYELWRTELGSDPAVLSRSIQLGSDRRLVVGVAPPGFHFPPGNATDVIVPHAACRRRRPRPAAPDGSTASAG